MGISPRAIPPCVPEVKVRVQSEPRFIARASSIRNSPSTTNGTTWAARALLQKASPSRGRLRDGIVHNSDNSNNSLVSRRNGSQASSEARPAQSVSFDLLIAINEQTGWGDDHSMNHARTISSMRSRISVGRGA